MFGLGTTELILILVIVVIFFGAGKLPEVGAGIAKGIRNFKKNLGEQKKEESNEDVIEIQDRHPLDDEQKKNNSSESS